MAQTADLYASGWFRRGLNRRWYGTLITAFVRVYVQKVRGRALSRGTYVSGEVSEGGETKPELRIYDVEAL